MGVLVLTWPTGKMLGAMEDMLHAIQHDRPRCANVQQAFDAQHGFPMRVQQHTQPDAKGDPIEWVRKGQGEGAYLCIMRLEHSWGVRSPLEQLWRHGGSQACHSWMADLWTQQPMRVEVTEDGGGQACRRIVLAQTFPERRNGVREGQVGLGDNDLIGQRYLFTGHWVPVE